MWTEAWVLPEGKMYCLQITNGIRTATLGCEPTVERLARWEVEFDIWSEVLSDVDEQASQEVG